VIGDSHIGLKDGDESKMVSWLERLRAAKPTALYLNGDVFHYFIGNPNFITSSVERVFEKLQQLRDEGTAIHYVEGNRDFFVKGSIAEKAVSEVSTASTIQAGDKRYFVIHGDMINDRDLPYRFWRYASKNIITRLAVGLIPKKTARRFVDSVEKKLARSNFKHKTRLPVELMEAYGRARANEGIDVVVLGHFHHKLVLDTGPATVAVLPAWFIGGEAMRISPTTGAYEFVVV
ncbi:MAG TPA: UDP-2,3-diacylglucosamine diphosphatase, partial [Thermoanaerobaculia bacterium]|nr:UDP-2,3-diacylglucosamine diphosphatase [Thermoanaerobaculia bacterium]